MGASLPNVSWDDRRALERARRSQLVAICRAEGIDIDREDREKKFYLSMLENAGVDLRRPHPALDWFEVRGKDEHGNTHSEIYPVVPEHDSAGKNINYDALIAAQAEKAAAEAEAAEQHSAQQQGMIEQLLARLERLEQSTIPLERASIPQLKKVAKDRGIDISELKTKQDYLDALGE